MVVILLITIKGPSANGSDVLSNVVHHYTEETSASIVPIETNIQLADISGLVDTGASINNQGQIKPQESTPPSTYTLSDKDSSIQAIDSVSTDYLDTFKADQVVKYTVQSGDTIGSIATNFGVSINTIVWANSLKNPDTLSLNQVLKIPPVSGVIATIQSGDTVASLAKKYKADSSKILSFNNLTDGESLQAGDVLMVPGGELPGPKPIVKSKGSGGSGIYVPVGDGQCVAFVQAHGFSNLHGNAYQWAQYINTPTPITGSVVVLKGGKYGHVALVTAVKEGSVQVVEQNYYGHYIIDHREISLSDKSIVGFIQ